MVVNTIIKMSILLLILITMKAIDAVEVTIDRNSVRVNETFEFTINMTSAPVDQPELRGLPEDLEVLRSSNFYRKSTINGRSNVEAGWTFTIKALNEGVFTIPSFDIDGSQTQPLTIRVLPAVSSADIDGQADAIKIVSEINTDNVYVQQQLRYTIRLYRSVRAQYASLTEPELEGALIERLGDDIQYETMIDSVRYRVLERHYAIFPQRAGRFVIPGVTYSAEVAAGRQSFGTLGSLRGRSRSLSLSSDDHTIDVKPIPASVNDWWLPASNVTIEQSWKPDSDQLEVGTPVTWTYSIVADGLTATQLPDVLPEEIDGLKYYPETANESNQTFEGKLIGKRTQTIAVIAAKSGQVTIPAMNINWWNITTDQAEVLTLPARTFQVISDGTTHSTAAPAASEPELRSGTEVEPMVEPSMDTSVTDQAESDNNIRYWQFATGLFVLLWIVTLIWRSSKGTTGIDPNITESNTEAAQPTAKHLTQAANKAIKGGQPQQIAQALIALAQSQIATIRSLADINRVVTDQPLKQQLSDLEQHLYGRASSDSWNPSALLQQLDNLTQQLQQHASHRDLRQHKLQPLHPTDV